MHPRMIRSIFRKDLRDAIRDSRVLVAVLVPIAIGILYNFIFQDTTPTPSATIAWYSENGDQLLDSVQSVAGDTVRLSFVQQQSADDVRGAVADQDVDIGIVVPAGFDVALRQGSLPHLDVLLPDNANFGGDYVAATIAPALRLMAGQQPPALVDTSRVSTGEGDRSGAIFNELGPRRYFVLIAIVLEIGMISMIAVPIILTEEAEKRTIEALVLVASYVDIVIAKALVGLTYIVVAVALLMSVTRIVPERIALFVCAVLALGITLIGFGLLLGGLFRSANQLNTWGGVVLLPVLAPAFAVGLPVPWWVQSVFDLLPTSQATRVIIDSTTNQQFFSQTWLSFVVLGIWAVGTYALLVYRLAQREA